jgi:hypothetical protein
MNDQRILLMLAGATVCISLMFFITPTQGTNIVIGGNTTDIGTIIFVAPKPGDAPATAGAALLGTVNGITDNSADNPYLIKVGPGVYDLGTSSLQMKEYVDIEGSGENTTKITGMVTGWPPNGTINGASNAELRFLTVENTGTGGNAVALVNSSASPSILHVTASVLVGTANYAVCNISSSPAMTNVTATASGGTVNNYGVYNNSSSPVMTNVTARGSGVGTSLNLGVYNIASSPVMTNVTATASGGTDNRGVFNSISGTVKINHSVIKGIIYTIYNGSGVTTRVGNTQLDGGAVHNDGTLTCAGVYDENYTFYTSTCP